MKILILGASGATGRHLVAQLLKREQAVKVLIRPSSQIPESWHQHEKVSIIQANLQEISVEEMANYVKDCQAVVSCLGHNLTLKGIYGKPRKLVRDAVILVCKAIEKNAHKAPVKFVLMNTAGNQNRDLHEPISYAEKIALGLIRFLLPPHPDNEQAADFLRVKIGQNHSFIHWAVVRPDTLINEEEVTAYSIHASPIRSAFFNPRKTSRINVGDFMAKLIVNKEDWNKWKGKMPVIYNVE